MEMEIIVAAVLAFLVGMAIGIAGCFFTTIARFEKEIEEIFETTFNKYKRKLNQKDEEIKRKEEENKRLHSSLVNLQIKLAKMKEGRK